MTIAHRLPVVQLSIAIPLVKIALTSVLTEDSSGVELQVPGLGKLGVRVTEKADLAICEHTLGNSNSYPG